MAYCFVSTLYMIYITANDVQVVSAVMLKMPVLNGPPRSSRTACI